MLGNKDNRCDVAIVKFAAIIYEMHDAMTEVAARYDIPLSIDKYTGKTKEGSLLQYLGSDWGRKLKGGDVWVNATKLKVDLIMDNWNPDRWNSSAVVIINDDTRFENEFHAFDEYNSQHCRVLKVRLEVPEEVRRSRCSQWRENTSCSSETGLDAYAIEGRFDMIFRTDLMDSDQIVEKIYNAMFHGA
jgi:hypothetical protein